MLPYLDLGPLHLNLYTLFNGLAALVGAAVLFHRWTAGGVPPATARKAVVAGLSGGILGAFVTGWILAVLGAAVPRGGTRLVASELGLLGGGAFAVLIVLRRAGVALAPAVDRAVVPVTLAQAISRMGCVAAGCCFGRPASGPLAVALPDLAGRVCPRYPTQAVMVAFHLVAIPILLAVERRWRARPGSVASLYVLAFLLFRAALEPFRGDVRIVLWGMTGTQLLALPLAVLAATALALSLRRHGRHGGPPVA